STVSSAVMRVFLLNISIKQLILKNIATEGATLNINIGTYSGKVYKFDLAFSFRNIFRLNLT
ncbi:MAG: hypothetical protein ACK5FV_02700, partial [Bacteroidota bacterium]